MKRLLAMLLAAAVAVSGCGGGGSLDSPSAADGLPGLPAGSAPIQGAGAGGDGGSGTAGGGSGSSGTASSSDSGTTGGGDAGTGSGVAGGPGGVGSGGTGVDGGTGVAAAGGDTGVGSGGTGVSSASVGIGSVDGFGSIIVNGIRYDIRQAQLSLSDAAGLKLGMTVRVTGTVNAEAGTGTATRVISAPELRGRISGVDRAAGRFTLLSVPVSIDSATVFEGLADASGLADGQEVQVYGLPGGNGELRATRIERLATEQFPVISGAVRNLDRGEKRFSIAGLVVSYATATVDLGGPETALTEGTLVRVPGSGLANGLFIASAVQWWQAPAAREGQTLNLGGLVSDFASPSSFRLQGVTVDASAAQITGAPLAALGNGVRVELSGQMRNGVLAATRVKIRHSPGAGGPASFSAEGTVGQFLSAADFRVQGQPIDASGPHVVFGNGTAQQLRPGARVKVIGSRVADGVLIADRVDFVQKRGDDDDDD